MANTTKPLRVGLISLGCAKNLVDAEVMLGSLLRDGLELTNDATEADVLIVNTCSFIDAAQEESVDTILQSAQVREANHRGQGLVVSGCLPQRFPAELPELLPEVDAFMGIDQVVDVSRIVREAHALRQRKLATAPIPPGKRPSRRLRTVRLPKTPAEPTPAPMVQINRRPRYVPDYATPRFRLTPKHFAYVKIAEGCNHPCSFCTIPRMRGSHRSRALDDILREAGELIGQGVRELNLISQDSTYYGLDLRPHRAGPIAAPARFAEAARQAGTPTLCTLLRELNGLPGKFWIRLLYTHPAHWTDELIETIAACPKVARYVDMPLQHIHGAMLERMRRETSQEYIVDLIARIRAGVPGIALRTTFIVGFPGETEACFQALIEFIRETRFERLGVFTYSPENGTLAQRMAAQVPRRVKEQRREQAMAAQLDIAREIARSFMGRKLTVLTEKSAGARQLQAARLESWEHGHLRASRGTGADAKSARSRPGPGLWTVARGEADAPDIDGRVYIQGELNPGEFAEVKVTGHTDYDLIARLA